MRPFHTTLTQLWPMPPFYNPGNTTAFVMFSGGKKWKHWPEIG